MNALDHTRVWRYMSFAKFVWTIQNRCLWLCRADLLGDPWEISLSGAQLQHIIDRHPISPIDEAPGETAAERAQRIIGLWRRTTFINCWNKSPHESNALWKIYCDNTDGIALQTTYEKLKRIGGRHPLLPVTYPPPGSNSGTPTRAGLITKKRPMFAYEEEVRIVFRDENNEVGATRGVRLNFNFEQLIESVRIHPGANDSFFDTVQTIVNTYAPNFAGTVVWSDMALQPPL